MPRMLSVVVLSVAISGLAATRTSAQTVSNGPYYATPSWDQQIPCDTPANCARFIVLANWNDEAVLDRETGLVWQRDPSSVTVPWSLSVDAVCAIAITGGRAGWRLPTLPELSTLTNGLYYMAAGAPFPPDATGTYWTTTSSVSNPMTAAMWGILTPGGSGSVVSGSTAKSTPFRAWCVRGPGFNGQ